MRVLAILGWGLLVACATASATEDQVSEFAIVCPHTDGLIDGPYVAEESTARAIAVAIIEQMQSRERQAEYDLNVEDDGAFWTAFQSVRGFPRRDGDSITVMMGGGGLTMRIAKCDGALSSMHWQR